MEVSPALIKQTRAWLKKASTDLRSAVYVMTSNPPLAETAVFLCEQAAEKTFKAFLTFYQVVFRKTHMIEEIGGQCVKVDSTLAALVDSAVPLTEYASIYRYPGEPDEASLAEANEAIQIAQCVYDGILERLPSETHPPSV